MTGFYAYLAAINEAKRRTPTASGEVDRWLKAVEELAKDLEEYKKVKSTTDKKLKELKDKQKKAKKMLDKEREQEEKRRDSVRRELLSAKAEKGKDLPKEGKAKGGKKADGLEKRTGKDSKSQKKPS